jgi:hypothetical protein
MRHGVVAAAAVVMLVAGLPRLTAAEEKRQIVAVFGIEARDIKLKPSVLASLTGYLASKLSESGQYEVVPQDKLAEALAAKKKESYKNCYKQSCQIEIGQELAASKALATQVMKVGTKCTVTVNLYDLAKKTSGKASTAKGPCSEDGIQGSIDEAVNKLTISSAAPASPSSSPSPMPTPAPTPTPAPAPTPTPAGKGWLGVKFKNDGGVVVVTVFKGTPAQKAGLQKGDVIMHMNKEPATSREQIGKWIGSQRPGVKIIVGVKRQGKLRQVTAVLEDSNWAASVYRQACNDGDTDACTIVGRMLARGQGIPEDHAQAAAVWRKGCEAGAMDSCSGLGVQYLRGLGVAKDVGKAVELYRKACEGGSMTGCNNLGMLHVKGLGVAKDPNKAAQLWRKACEGGSMSGCSNLGMLHAKGLGVAKDRARAVVLYRKACDGGNREGCKRLRMLVGK